MFSVNLCFIATNRYLEFLPAVMASADRFFLPDFDVVYHIFTNHQQPAEWKPVYRTERWHYWPHEPWPGPTLHRYHAMLSAKEELLEADYSYYLDVDMRFVDFVGDEILGNLVATQHPGYVGKEPFLLPYERRLESTACVLPRNGLRYHAGAFQGGRSHRWVKVMQDLREQIDIDQSRNVVAKNHDESHWNKYLITNPPSLLLSDLYCTPETRMTPGRKILALDKNHGKYRAP